MTEASNQTEAQATEQAAPKAEKPKKAPREKKLTREAFLLAKVNEGITDVLQLAKLVEEEIAAGKLRVRPTLRKLEANSKMWVDQVKWYIHQMKKKGLIPGEVTVRAPRKKKEKPAAEAAAPAPEAQAPAAETQASAPKAEEDIGNL